MTDNNFPLAIYGEGAREAGGREAKKPLIRNEKSRL